MQNERVVILTGGTGVFGRFLAKELLKHNLKLVLLVLADSLEQARSNVQKVLGKQADKVEIFCSDLTKEMLGLSESDYNDLYGRATHILHAAASIRFNLPLEQSRHYNVKTTEQVISFAKKCSNLIRLGFTSSVMVAGKRSGIILEDEFEHQEGFKNTYEQTKYEAEKLVREEAPRMPIAIFRPPLVITPVLPDKDLKGPTNLLTLGASFIAKGYLPFSPGTKDSTIDIVDSFDAARIIVELFLKEHLSHMTYHITNGNRALKIGAIHDMLEKKFGKAIPLKFYGDMKSFEQQVNKIPWYKFGLRTAYKRSSSFLPEAAYPKIFDNRNTLSELNISRIGEDPINTLQLLLKDK